MVTMTNAEQYWVWKQLNPHEPTMITGYQERKKPMFILKREGFDPVREKEYAEKLAKARREMEDDTEVG